MRLVAVTEADGDGGKRQVNGQGRGRAARPAETAPEIGSRQVLFVKAPLQPSG